MEYMFAPLKKYAQFSGRARRKEYWLFQLVVCVLLGTVVFVGRLLSATLPPRMEELALVPMIVVGGGLLIPTFAAGVRRLHDIGRSGWWMLVGLVPFIGGIWQLILLLAPGDVGVNRYGLDPREPEWPVLPSARVV